MLVFALGTVPLMFAFGALSALLNSRFARVMGKVSAVLVILIGFTMLGRSFGLSGVALPSAAADGGLTGIVVVDSLDDGNVQRITSVCTDHGQTRHSRRLDDPRDGERPQRL